jgi:hypothetical protein
MKVRFSLFPFVMITQKIIRSLATSAIGEVCFCGEDSDDADLLRTDYKTDAIIQQSLRNELKDVTLITIAHRLQTIMDADKIVCADLPLQIYFLILCFVQLVLDAGRVVCHGSQVLCPSPHMCTFRSSSTLPWSFFRRQMAS